MHPPAAPSQSLKPILVPLVPQALGAAHFTKRRITAALFAFKDIISTCKPSCSQEFSTAHIAVKGHSPCVTQTNFLSAAFITSATQPLVTSLREADTTLPPAAASIVFTASACLIAIFHPPKISVIFLLILSTICAFYASKTRKITKRYLNLCSQNYKLCLSTVLLIYPPKADTKYMCQKSKILSIYQQYPHSFPQHSVYKLHIIHSFNLFFP